MYGVYMPRGHPSDCFITGPRRIKDVGDDIPSAPPGLRAALITII